LSPAHGCDKFWRIARPSRRFTNTKILSRYSANHIDHFANGISMACSQIERLRLDIAAHQSLKPHNVSAGEIRHMDIVAQARAVRCRIVGSKDPDVVAQSRGRTQDERDQMSFRIVVLAEIAVRIRAGGVEIA